MNHKMYASKHFQQKRNPFWLEITKNGHNFDFPRFTKILFIYLKSSKLKKSILQLRENLIII